MTKIEEYYLLVCTAREGSMAVGTLVYDHGMLLAGPFALSKNWLAVGGAVLPSKEVFCLTVFQNIIIYRK